VKLRLPRGSDPTSASGQAIQSLVYRRGAGDIVAGCCGDVADWVVVVRWSDEEKAVRVLSQARRRVIVVRRNDLQEGDGLSSARRW
jgi:hypothetical protein